MHNIPEIRAESFFDVLLISDLFDGYFYRKYSRGKLKHWFNRLPITMDPIADFVLGISNWTAIGLSNQQLRIFSVVMIIFLALFGLISNKIRGKILKVVTYGWFIIAMLMPIWVMWIKIDHGIVGIFLTTISFYYFYFTTR